MLIITNMNLGCSLGHPQECETFLMMWNNNRDYVKS